MIISNYSSVLNSSTMKGAPRSARARQMRSGRSTPNIDIFRPSAYNTPISITPISQLDRLIPEAKPASKPSKTRTNTRKRKAQATDFSGINTPVAKRPRRHPPQRHNSGQRSQKGVQGSHDPPSSRTSSRYARYKLNAARGSTTSETSQILGSVEAKEVLRRARETVHQLQVDLTSQSTLPGRKLFLMDVILNSQAPNLANLEDVLTAALEGTLSRAVYTDEVQGTVDCSDFSYEAPSLWRGLTVESWDLSPRKIYHVSAERSTVTWNPTLDGEHATRVSEDADCEEGWNCACGPSWSPRSSPRS